MTLDDFDPKDVRVEDQRHSEGLKKLLELIRAVATTGAAEAKRKTREGLGIEPPPIQDFKGNIYKDLDSYILKNPWYIRRNIK